MLFRSVGGFCEKLRLTEDREFLIRLARKGAGRLVPDLLWEKSWVDDSLSNRWEAAGRGLIAYDALHAERIRGRNSRDIAHILGTAGRAEMIHRDDMALAER